MVDREYDSSASHEMEQTMKNLFKLSFFMIFAVGCSGNNGSQTRSEFEAKTNAFPVTSKSNCTPNSVVTSSENGVPTCDPAPQKTADATPAAASTPVPAPAPVPAVELPKSFAITCVKYPKTNYKCANTCGGGANEAKCPSTWKTPPENAAYYNAVQGCVYPYATTDVNPDGVNARCTRP